MGQKTFYPGISIKTLENRLVRVGNHKSHPKPESVSLNGEFLSETYRKDKQPVDSI